MSASVPQPGPAPLPPMDVPGRLARLRLALGEAGCDALLVTRLVDVRYLTGFSGSAGLLLVGPDEAVLATDGRYREQVADELAGSGVEVRVEIVLTGEAQREAVAAAARGHARVGVDATAVTWAQQRALAATWFPDAELVPTDDVVAGLRLVKDEGEVARISAAGAITDAALAEVVGLFGERPSEAEVAAELDHRIRLLGASGSAFETIVAAGPNGARPHARPGPRRLAEGDLVVVDVGAVVDGYRSDMTRTFVLGEPSPTQRRMLEVVTEAQRLGVAAAGPGVPCADVDRACREAIGAAGWADAFAHGTGHGVGLDIHEAPRVAAGSADTLAVGHVVTVEPGVYLPEHGGVRVEDTVVVTHDGCRPLTHAPKDPKAR